MGGWGDKNNIHVKVIHDNIYSSIIFSDSMEITCLLVHFQSNQQLFDSQFALLVTHACLVLYQVVVQTFGLSATIAAITI